MSFDPAMFRSIFVASRWGPDEAFAPGASANSTDRTGLCAARVFFFFFLSAAGLWDACEDCPSSVANMGVASHSALPQL